MGLFSRFFGEKDEVATNTPFDEAAVRPLIEALIDATGELIEAMSTDESPTNNPGWAGRVRDFRNTRGDLRILLKRRTFGRDELFDVLITARPLFRGTPPAAYAHLTGPNSLVIETIEAVHRAAD